MTDMSTGPESHQCLLRTRGGCESELLPGQRAKPLGTSLCKMRAVKMKRWGGHRVICVRVCVCVYTLYVCISGGGLCIFKGRPRLK